MTQPTVRNIKTKVVIGVLLGFAVSGDGVRFAVVRPKSRALNQLIDVSVFAKTMEVCQ